MTKNKKHFSLLQKCLFSLWIGGLAASLETNLVQFCLTDMTSFRTRAVWWTAPHVMRIGGCTGQPQGCSGPWKHRGRWLIWQLTPGDLEASWHSSRAVSGHLYSNLKPSQRLLTKCFNMSVAHRTCVLWHCYCPDWEYSESPYDNLYTFLSRSIIYTFSSSPKMLEPQIQNGQWWQVLSSIRIIIYEIRWPQ